MTEHSEPNPNELNELRGLINAEQASQLLLEATPAMTTGASVVTGKTYDDKIQRQMVGYVEISEESEWGAMIVERDKNVAQGEELQSVDNATRWTLIDSDKVAIIVLEGIEGPEEDPTFRGVISFEYPKDRDCLLIGAVTGRFFMRAGTHGLPHEGQVLEKRTHEDDVVREEYREEHARNTQILEISTGKQIARMIEIMDARNPQMPKRTVHQIMRHLDVSASPDSPITGKNWLGSWMELGDTHEERLRNSLIDSTRPLQDTVGILSTFALRHALSHDHALTTAEIAQLVDMEERIVEAHLWRTFQADESWAWGRQRQDGEFEWLLDPLVQVNEADDIHEYAGYDLMSGSGRLQAAYEMLESLGIKIPLDEVSPAMQLMSSIVDFMAADEMITSLIQAKTPVWASAKGFAKIYDQCKTRARLSKRIGMKDIAGIDRLHIQTGHSLQIAHVITLTSEQVNVLPEMSVQDQSSFMRETRLPFDPLFLDFTADSKLPGLESKLGGEIGYISVLGALINTSPSDEEVVFITPVFYYGNEVTPLQAVVLGSIAVNRSDDRNHRFEYVMGSSHRFVERANNKIGGMLVLVADSEILRQAHNRPIMHEYEEVIQVASYRAVSALYLFEAANIEIVPAQLDRREKKRQEKRNWLIPLTVRVDRPAKRPISQNGHGEAIERDYSHQWEVTGCYHHVTKGAAVRCIVCEGKETEGIVCPRCNGTKLDPDKVKPCTRIDVRTGEKTCPLGCRRIWHREHVKGPEDRPLVIKTRKITKT